MTVSLFLVYKWVMLYDDHLSRFGLSDDAVTLSKTESDEKKAKRAERLVDDCQ